MRHRIATITAAVVLGASAGACGAESDEAAPDPKVAAQLAAIERRAGGPFYYLGDSFDGLPLTHAQATGPQAFFVYGTCDASEHGCAPPLQVQQFAIASPARYDTPWRGCVRTTVRGVPAAQFDGFEVYTGDALVKIYAGGYEKAKAAAAALRPLGATSATGSLPPPTIDLDEPLRGCAVEDVAAKVRELRAARSTTLYWVGNRFEEHPLARAEGDGRWARFLYGACVQPAPTDAGCWPPLTIEVQPLTKFRPAGWAPGVDCRVEHVGSAAAALVRNANELVLFTGEVAVRLQGEDHALLRRAAVELRALHASEAGEPLPPPAEGLAAELRRACSS